MEQKNSNNLTWILVILVGILVVAVVVLAIMVVNRPSAPPPTEPPPAGTVPTQAPPEQPVPTEGPAPTPIPGDPEQARFAVGLRMPGIRRVFSAKELSDGTLRYLCLLAALMSPQPPSLIALNEPETSIHPDLIDPPGRLIVNASREYQIWVTTHSRRLADCIAEDSGQLPIELEMVDGETRVVGAGALDR